METVVIGVRGSQLAQIMAREYVVRLAPCPVVRFKTRIITTDGDRDRRSPLHEVGGDGAFTSRLQEELLAGGIDVAVHSLKDLPTEIPSSLTLVTTPPRADVRDALCGSTLAGLRLGARVGTGSRRRVAQLKALRPDLDIVPIRGNVPPRLGRLKTGLDGVVLAAAGLYRLGLEDQIGELLPPELFPPSPGQGALGIQVRSADTELREMLCSMGDPATDAEVRAERAVLAGLHGGCSIPVGAYAVHADSAPGLGPFAPDHRPPAAEYSPHARGRGPFAPAGEPHHRDSPHRELRLSAQVTSLDGTRKVTASATGRDPEALGAQLCAALVDSGAEEILREIRTLA